ncbi:hypothetical protein [Heyndrickxia acidiproducens]|uniref:hypothetical protein n=1 Tax=Heyndrickxia acidiproducens TaxID=1121084 RepID=UPI0003A832AB|nr:hypothetical protein [Heyndrickxia acidiproducens]
MSVTLTEVTKAHAEANKKIAVGIDMSKVMRNLNQHSLRTNDEGQIVLDRNNPRDMEWIEE